VVEAGLAAVVGVLDEHVVRALGYASDRANRVDSAEGAGLAE